MECLLMNTVSLSLVDRHILFIFSQSNVGLDEIDQLNAHGATDNQSSIAELQNKFFQSYQEVSKLMVIKYIL